MPRPQEWHAIGAPLVDDDQEDVSGMRHGSALSAIIAIARPQLIPRSAQGLQLKRVKAAQGAVTGQIAPHPVPSPPLAVFGRARSATSRLAGGRDAQR
jgi:hypothetical protein